MFEQYFGNQPNIIELVCEIVAPILKPQRNTTSLNRLNHISETNINTSRQVKSYIMTANKLLEKYI